MMKEILIIVGLGLTNCVGSVCQMSKDVDTLKLKSDDHDKRLSELSEWQRSVLEKSAKTVAPAAKEPAKEAPVKKK